MQTSCISHPAHNPVAVVKRDYYEICDHNEVAAAILALLEYWHNVKLENQKQARHRNSVAANHGEAPTQDEDLWQWHTEESLEESLMGIGRRDAIRQAIKLLGAGEPAVKDETGKEKKPEIVGKNFITVGLNPNPRYKFDRTRYFLFNPQPVQEAINKFYSQPEPNPIPDPPKPTNQSTSAENQGRRVENQFSLHEITSENTTKSKGETPFDPDEFVDTPPPPQERLQGQLTPLEATVAEITGEQSRHWSVVDKIRTAAATFAKLGITVEDLHEFDRQRAKTCKLNFLTSEVSAWWRDKSKRGAAREPFDIREKYKDSLGTRFVILACGWQDTFHLQNAWNVQSTEELGRYLDISTRTNEWNRYSPNRFVRFWREECGNTSVITPEIIRKYIGQYQRWEAQQLVAA
jgi:hypothetical protein